MIKLKASYTFEDRGTDSQGWSMRLVGRGHVSGDTFVSGESRCVPGGSKYTNQTSPPWVRLGYFSSTGHK